jgi:mannose-6-phosphate isomerase-like protein (cupin superfamily)
MVAKLQGWSLVDKKGTFFSVETESAHCQTAVMTLRPGEDGGQEPEGHIGDQVLFVAEGEVTVMTEHEEMRARAGTVVTIPARTPHRVRNAGSTVALLLCVYSPPSY